MYKAHCALVYFAADPIPLILSDQTLAHSGGFRLGRRGHSPLPSFGPAPTFVVMSELLHPES